MVEQESGRSLIEMLGVLAIGAVMTAGAYATYNMLRTNQVRNMALSEMEQIARNTKILLETRGDYRGVSVEYLVKAGAITETGAPLGGDDWYITSSTDGKSFSINLTNLSATDCSYLAAKKIKWATKVSVNKIETGGSERCISDAKNFVSFIVE